MSAHDTPGGAAPVPPATVRVYVNERPVDVPRAATVLDAIRAFDAAEGDAVAGGARMATDSRGLPVAAAEAVYAGAIYRLVAARRTAAPGAAGDHA